MLKDIAAKTKVRKNDRTTWAVHDCIGIVSLRPVIGLETRHSFSQSDTKLKPIVTWSVVFSRALGRLRHIHFEFSLDLCDVSFALISCCD